MLFSRDKDDDDFTPNNHSNLANIFGSSGSDGNPSLTYTAPKQPKKHTVNKVPPTAVITTPPPSSNGTSNVVVAKSVQTFKMMDGEYKNQGRAGAAVICISSDEGIAYQLLLYRDKRHHLCTSRIIRDFKFYVQPKNYCTFYDKLTAVWSILFENMQDMAEFSLQVAVARWNDEVQADTILIQDLWCPVGDDSMGSKAAAGDFVEITYAITTINDTSLGEESQTVGVEVENSGWKQALVGVQQTTKKVIILQPFMLGDLNPKEESFKSPVAVKLTVIQVTKAETKAGTVDQSKKPRNITAEEMVQTYCRPEFVASSPEKSKDCAESPRGSPNPTKADLINRMARMGKALPFKTAAPTPSDSDETEEDRVICSASVRPKPRSRSAQQISHHPVTSTPPPAPPQPVVGDTSTLSRPLPQPMPVQWSSVPTPYVGGTVYSVPQLQSPVDVQAQAQFNMFFSEVRTTNSELRMGITRLTDKVEALHSKLQYPEKKPDNQETALVLHRLLDNEQQLKNQLTMLTTALNNMKLSSQSHASGEPVSSSESWPRSAEREEGQTLTTDRLKKLEEENEFLRTTVSAQKDVLQNARFADQDQMVQIAALENQLVQERLETSKLKQEVKDIEAMRCKLVEELNTARLAEAKLLETIGEKQTNIDKLEEALSQSEESKIEEVRRNLQEVLNPKPMVEDHIKNILNHVYKLIKTQFEPEKKYEAVFIQSLLAETIRAVTLEYLENGDPDKLALSHTNSTPIFNSEQNLKKKNGCQSREQRTTAPSGSKVKSEAKVKKAPGTLSETLSSEFSTPLVNSDASLDAHSIHVLHRSENSHNNDNTVSDSHFVLDPEVMLSNPPNAETPFSAIVDDLSNDIEHATVSEKLKTVLIHLTNSQTRLWSGQPLLSMPLSLPTFPLPDQDSL